MTAANGSGALDRNTVQIHLTRRCNLRCLHCYSSSGPRETASLAPADVIDFLRIAKGEGYEAAAFSGGEPLLYRELDQVLSAARELGLGTSLVTNGMLFDERRARELRGIVDVMAVSLDGPEATHNYLRGSNEAFRVMERRLPHIRESGIPFGFVHTVTRSSLPSLRWLAEFAVESGARLLQLHPLGQTGYAAENLMDAIPCDEMFTRIYLAAALLRKEFDGALRVHVDLFNKFVLERRPELVYADEYAPTQDRPLSALVNPLVVSASGEALPIAHGFHTAYAIGPIQARTWPQQRADFLARRYPRFRALCRRVYDEALPDLSLPYFNWYDLLERASHERSGASLCAPAVPLTESLPRPV